MATLTVRDKLQITTSDLALRKNWVGLTDEDLELIRATKEFLAPQADEIAKEFYDFGFQFREFAQVAERAGTTRQILEGAQKAYIMAGVAQQLQASSSTMTESSDKVGQAVTEASAQAEESAAFAQEVSASVEEVTAQIGEITNKTGALSSQVETLDAIARLVLETDERMELYRQHAQAREQEAA